MKKTIPSTWANVSARVGVGVIIHDENGQVCLEQRSDCGLWGLVGGRIDAGESVEEAAVREAFEETGLEIVVEYLQGVYSDPRERTVEYENGDQRQLVDAVVVAGVLRGTISCSAESLDVRFFDRDGLPSDLVPAATASLEDYLAGRRGVLR